MFAKLLIFSDIFQKFSHWAPPLNTDTRRWRRREKGKRVEHFKIQKCFLNHFFLRESFWFYFQCSEIGIEYWNLIKTDLQFVMACFVFYEKKDKNITYVCISWGWPMKSPAWREKVKFKKLPFKPWD